MAYNQTKTIYKLRQAIEHKGYRLLFNSTEFYSKEKQRPIAIYHIKEVTYNPETEKDEIKELFASPSHIQIVFFLRDYLFSIDGKELPTDNMYWNEIRKKIVHLLPIDSEAIEVSNKMIEDGESH